MDGVSPSWLVAERVLLVRFEGDHLTETMYRLDHWVKNALESTGNSHIALIGDFTRMGERWPPLHEQLQFKSVRDPRIACVLTINARRNRILNFCVRTILRMAGKPHHDFETVDNALDYLRQLDQTLSLP